MGGKERDGGAGRSGEREGKDGVGEEVFKQGPKGPRGFSSRINKAGMAGCLQRAALPSAHWDLIKIFGSV